MEHTPDTAFARLLVDGHHDAAEPDESFDLLVRIKLANVEPNGNGVRYVLREIGS